MCRILTHAADIDPGDAACTSPNVEALTGSVMAGLATLDGICGTLPLCTSPLSLSWLLVSKKISERALMNEQHSCPRRSFSD